MGQESILSPYRLVMATQPRKIRQAWYDYAVQFCEKEDYLTHAEHLMIVSRKDAEERAASKKTPAKKGGESEDS